MTKRKAMGSNIVDAVAGLETPAGEASPKPKEAKVYPRQTYHIEKALVEKIKGVAYIERMTVSGVVVTALRQYIERMEKKRGEPYLPIKEALKGRPIR